MDSPVNLAAFRITRAVKEALLKDELPRGNTHEQKRREAIAWLGPRWILHRCNRVTRKEVKRRGG